MYFNILSHSLKYKDEYVRSSKMIIYEFKAKAKPEQDKAIDKAIHSSQFIQNKYLRYWISNEKVKPFHGSKKSKFKS